MHVRVALWGSLLSSRVFASAAFPTICDVVNTPTFQFEVNLQSTPATCEFPARPCSQISYYVPHYFVEVVNNPRESFFSKIPGVALQLTLNTAIAPFAAEDDNESYSFHAHVIHIPFSQEALAPMPCGGGAPDLFCLSVMSEHLGTHWSTGAPDMWQPKLLAWSLSPKACLVKGALTSITGDWTAKQASVPQLCSVSLEWLPKYPPSLQAICTGWGIHFPRSGTVTSSDQTTASLIVASRIKSLGAEVFQSLAIEQDEKWQMIYPQTSSSFREGQNIAYLRVKGVNELGRIGGKFRNYLYVIWQKRTCIRDLPFVAEAHAWLATLQSACKGL